jgi:hypothetical protein
MLTKAERETKNYYYKQQRVPYHLILKVYENSNYDESCVFRKFTLKLDDYKKRKCFELMDEIDRKFYFKEPEAQRRESIKKICDLLNLNPNEYYNIY